MTTTEAPLKRRLLDLRDELAPIYDHEGARAAFEAAAPLALKHGADARGVMLVVYALARIREDRNAAASAVSSYASMVLPRYPYEAFRDEQRSAYIAALVALDLAATFESLIVEDLESILNEDLELLGDIEVLIGPPPERRVDDAA